MTFQKFREYSGIGKFIFKLEKEVEIASNFTLSFFSNGDAENYCSLNMFSKDGIEILNRYKTGSIEVELDGNISPNGKIEIKKLGLTSSHINSNDKTSSCTIKLQVLSEISIKFYKEIPKNVGVHFGLVNFIFGGCNKTQIGESGFKYDKFSIKVDNNNITFKQLDNYKEISEQLKAKKGILTTSEAISQCVYSEIKSMEALLSNIATLISFAVGTYVTWIYEDIFENGKLVETKLLPQHKTINYNHRDFVIDSDHLGHCDLKEFLEKSYKNYKMYKEDLGLYAVLDYYVSSKSIKDLLEIKYLVAVTSLDCLTSYLSDFFDKTGKKLDLCTFKNRMIALLEEFSITYNEDELDFIKTRDKIVHIGRFPKSKSPLNEYLKIINLIDRIVLNILRYSGKYQDIRNHYKKEILS